MYICAEFYKRLGMDRKQFTGILVIMMLLFAWTYFMKPSEEEFKKAKEAREITEQDTTRTQQQTNADTLISEIVTTVAGDSTVNTENKIRFGAFSVSAQGTEDFPVLENDNIKITFTNKGGKIKEVLLKKHFMTVTDSSKNDTKELIKMLNQPSNRFDFDIPVNDALGKNINTADIYFQTEKQGNSITFKAQTDNGGYFEQKYTLDPTEYNLNYTIQTKNLGKIVAPNSKALKLTWINHLNKYEKGESFEQNYSTVYYKEKAKKSDYCSCVKDDIEELKEKDIQWMSHSNQFFNTSIIANNDKYFANGIMSTKMTDLETSPYTKITSSIVDVPMDNWDNGQFDMTMYIGPNEFTKLRSFDVELENIIPFGTSIFGTINKWVIRPFFDFLSQYISSKGLVIILLIFLIKMALYPLMYKMLHSQAKMSALKPEIEGIKKKHKDDMQAQQMETMKIYREHGVSPFGGCLPMILQMPIWYALFRFFPASITFRQEPFLWAHDLSSFDVFFYLGFNIPFFGEHVSLFTLLWTASTIIYTYYNLQNMDMSANPAMKYVQYIMPIMFLGFFNNYASGLTCYMFFSNLFNIMQTVVTKKYVFDESKIRAELMREKAKPKKKSTFQERLEEAMKQQQAMKDQKKKK